jgi:hypothetical protein
MPYQHKGCLKRVVRSESHKASRDPNGRIYRITLDCGHIVEKPANKLSKNFKRIHCIECLQSLTTEK